MSQHKKNNTFAIFNQFIVSQLHLLGTGTKLEGGMGGVTPPPPPKAGLAGQ